jgi:isopenicillin N synthase-like dioxygenase
VVGAVVAAASSWGFFQLTNHGLSQSLLDEHYAAMQE